MFFADKLACRFYSILNSVIMVLLQCKVCCWLSPLGKKKRYLVLNASPLKCLWERLNIGPRPVAALVRPSMTQRFLNQASSSWVTFIQIRRLGKPTAWVLLCVSPLHRRPTARNEFIFTTRPHQVALAKSSVFGLRPQKSARLTGCFFLTNSTALNMKQTY